MARALVQQDSGAANGVASLDASVKIPLAQIPSGIAGASYIEKYNAIPGAIPTGVWLVPLLGTLGIPANALVDVLIQRGAGGGSSSGGVREVGSAILRTIPNLPNGEAVTMRVKADASGNFEVFRSATSVTFTVIGWQI